LKGEAFCPQCGKTGEKLFHGLCRSCFIEDLNLISVSDEINLTICTQCGSIQKKGKWYDSNLTLEDQAAETILEHVEVTQEVSNIQLVPELENIHGSTLEFVIKVTGEVLGEVVSREFLVKVKVNKEVCNECSKFASGYYEAVIQLRTDKRVPDDEEIMTADAIIAENIDKIAKKNKMAYISERAVLKEGVDYYVGSYKVAKRLSNSIKDHMGGIIKESPRLMGRDKSAGKDLYRVWISVRIPYFKINDFIKLEKTVGQILNIDGKRILIKDLISRNQISIQWRDYDKITPIARKEDVMETTVTAKTPDSIQILHPVTYEPEDLEINDEYAGIGIGSQIHVIEIDHILYILDTVEKSIDFSGRKNS